MSLLIWSKHYPSEISLVDLTPGDLKVLVTLAAYMNSNDMLSTTYRSIANKCKLTRRYTIARIKHLTDLNILAHRCHGNKQLLLWIKAGFSHRRDDERINPPTEWTDMFPLDLLNDNGTGKNHTNNNV